MKKNKILFLSLFFLIFLLIFFNCQTSSSGGGGGGDDEEEKADGIITINLTDVNTNFDGYKFYYGSASPTVGSDITLDIMGDNPLVLTIQDKGKDYIYNGGSIITAGGFIDINNNAPTTNFLADIGDWLGGNTITINGNMIINLTYPDDFSTMIRTSIEYTGIETVDKNHKIILGIFYNLSNALPEDVINLPIDIYRTLSENKGSFDFNINAVNFPITIAIMMDVNGNEKYDAGEPCDVAEVKKNSLKIINFIFK